MELSLALMVVASISIFIMIYNYRKTFEKPDDFANDVEDYFKQLVKDDQNTSINESVDDEFRLDKIEVVKLSDKDYAYMTGKGDDGYSLISMCAHIVTCGSADGIVPQNQQPYVIIRYWLFENGKKERKFDLTLETKDLNYQSAKHEVDAIWNSTTVWNNTVYPFLKGAKVDKSQLIEDYEINCQLIDNWKKTGNIKLKVKSSANSLETKGENAEGLPFGLAYIE